MGSLVTIVSGTWNRLSYLHRMMDSVRQQMPRHIAYDFVIVDGGSTDGTLEWLRSQADITLIEQGKLLGAIRAFTDGAEAAMGKYVLLANDDIIFHPGSILAAVVHLEDTPTCGGVAFADDRAKQMGEADGHRVLTMMARYPDGTPVHVAYAQVGLFRRWLGNNAGWWGADDSIMKRSRTYGGDNHLSSQIWQMGYSIDAVEGCVCDDLIARDELRQVNGPSGQQDSAAYYARWPKGPTVNVQPTTPSPAEFRILSLPIYEPAFPAASNKEYGISEALSAYGQVYELDYLNSPVDVLHAVRAWRPHFIFAQLHDVGKIDAAKMAEIRELVPGAVIVNWNGDAHEGGLIKPEIIDMLKMVDLQLVVNAKVLDVYKEAGVKAAYWQIGYKDPCTPYPKDVPSYDVLFLGNCYSQARHTMIGCLRAMPGIKVGVYGSCPFPNGNTHYDFAASRKLYERCKVAIGDTYPGTEAFVSNRFFQALSAGAFLLQQHSPRFDDLVGVKAGKHYIEWTDFGDLIDKVKKWTSDKYADRRRAIAEAGRDYIREHYSFDAQVAKLWELISSGN